MYNKAKIVIMNNRPMSMSFERFMVYMNAYVITIWNPEGKDHLEILSLYGFTILKIVLKNKTLSFRLTWRPMHSSCERCNEISPYIKWRPSWVPKEDGFFSGGGVAMLLSSDQVKNIRKNTLIGPLHTHVSENGSMQFAQKGSVLSCTLAGGGSSVCINFCVFNTKRG